MGREIHKTPHMAHATIIVFLIKKINEILWEIKLEIYLSNFPKKGIFIIKHQIIGHIRY